MNYIQEIEIVLQKKTNHPNQASRSQQHYSRRITLLLDVLCSRQLFKWGIPTLDPYSFCVRVCVCVCVSLISSGCDEIGNKSLLLNRFTRLYDFLRRAKLPSRNVISALTRIRHRLVHDATLPGVMADFRKWRSETGCLSNQSLLVWPRYSSGDRLAFAFRILPFLLFPVDSLQVGQRWFWIHDEPVTGL